MAHVITKAPAGTANARPVGGMHYNQYGNLQPWDVIEYYGLGFLDGNAVKYLLRWRHKGGLLDLEKAKHYVEKLLEQQRAVADLKARIEGSPAFKRKLKQLERNRRGNTGNGKGVSLQVRSPRRRGDSDSARRSKGVTMPPTSRRSR